MGFHHVGYAGLELTTSGGLPALASQSAGITGVSHHTQPCTPLLLQYNVKTLHRALPGDPDDVHLSPPGVEAGMAGWGELKGADLLLSAQPSFPSLGDGVPFG